MQFREFAKIPRLKRNIIITEKIDGTNASIYIEQRRALTDETIDDPHMPWLSKNEQGCVVAVGSRTRWILPGKTDNFGFAAWAQAHINELVAGLGPGHHYGEWWGSGIQRSYGLRKDERRFSLFNTSRWTSEFNKRSHDRLASTQCLELPCCHVVPVIATGIFHSHLIDDAITQLDRDGSFASPGFLRPEGIVVYHVAGGHYYKQTIFDDDIPKSIKIGDCNVVGNSLQLRQTR